MMFDARNLDGRRCPHGGEGWCAACNADLPRLRGAYAMRTLLAARFPACFAPRGGVKRPLAVGIAAAIARRAPDLDPAEIECGIEEYTGGTRYLAALTAGAVRIDLDGRPAGLVSEAIAATAARTCQRLRSAGGGREQAA